MFTLRDFGNFEAPGFVEVKRFNQSAFDSRSSAVAVLHDLFKGPATMQNNAFLFSRIYLPGVGWHFISLFQAGQMDFSP